MELLKQNPAVEDLSLNQSVAHEKTLVHECLSFQVLEENAVHERTHAPLCLNFPFSLAKWFQ